MDYQQHAITAFKLIKNSNPHLSMEISYFSEGPFEMEMDIEAQDGLNTPILMNLLEDTLHLGIGPFWGEWFPCDDPEVIESYTHVVASFIKGEARAKVFSIKDNPVKAVLQVMEAGIWQNTSTSCNLHWPFSKKTVHYIQNN